MIVLSGALVLVALVLLVFGAVDRNLPYVYASIGVSVLSLLLLFAGIVQRRGELDGDDQDDATTPVTDTSAELHPALAGADPEQDRSGQSDGGERTAELVLPGSAPAPAQQPAARYGSRRVVQAADLVDEDGDLEQTQDEEQLQDGELVDDEELQDREAQDLEDELADDEPEDDADEGSSIPVLVVSGRPRYHLEGCRVLRGKEPQPLDREDARGHGFSPCGVCKPDADEVAAKPAEQNRSITQALFGESPSAGGSPGDVEGDGTGALPDRPVQPLRADVEPAEPPASLRGDDPAPDTVAQEVPDTVPDTAPDVDDDLAADPAPDVAGDLDELPVADGAAPTAADEPAPTPDSNRSGAADPVGPDHVAPVPVPPGPVEAVAVDVPAAEVPVEAVSAGSRTTGRKAPAKRARKAAPAGRPRATLAQDAAAAEVEEVPADQAPVGKTPAKEVPAEGPAEGPAKKAPAKRAPAKRVPAKRAAAESAPAAAPAVSPPVKRPVVRAVRADALRLGSPSTRGTTTRVAARAAAPPAPGPVVVVPDRDRFHRPECRYVRGVAGATTLPKASANRQGYAACGVCKP